MNPVTGRCWCFGDDITTDALAPGQYIKAPIETLASHCLETVNPSFAAGIQNGDIIVAGRNFGMGSSREQAAQALMELGVGGVVASSFGGIFFRNAINLGLPVFSTEVDAADCNIADDTDQLELDPRKARLINHSRNSTVALRPLPEFLLDMLQSGGLVKVLEKRFNVTPSQVTV